MAKKQVKNVKKDFIKDNKKTIIAIALLVIFLIGGSYAWFTLTLHGEKKAIIKAGTLQMKLDETTSDGISIINTMPVTDQEGLEFDSYTFKLTNTGTLDSRYTVYLVDDEITSGKTRMDDSVVKYQLINKVTDNEANVVSGPTTVLDFLSSTYKDEKRVLDEGIIHPGEKIDYDLKVWMDYNAGNEYQDTAFKAKVKIEAGQAVK